MRTKKLNLTVVLCMAIVAIYLVWTALDSTACAVAGVQGQTRTTWTTGTGCVNQGHPSDAYQFEKSR